MFYSIFKFQHAKAIYINSIFKDRKILQWITLVLTYVRTYVQVIFEGSHPTLKLAKQKMSEIIQVNVPNFFYFDEITNMTKLGLKN